MKRISLAGVVLGLVAGALIAFLSGSWIFWLAIGLALGIVLGSASAKGMRRASAEQNGTSASGLQKSFRMEG
jgi:F0F1-type ATP synthase assembly protein I